MNFKDILKPTLVKIIIVILIFLISYVYFLFSIKVIWDCPQGSANCPQDTGKIARDLTLYNTLVIGIPLSILAWIIIGLIKTERKNSKSQNNLKEINNGKRRK